MPYPGERNSWNQQWVSAPWQSGPITTGMIMGVWVGDDEDVEWLWSHGPTGSFIMGYTVKKRLPPQEPFKTKEQDEQVG